MDKKRLFIVSNRLPVRIQTTAEELQVQPSAGGLVTAINSYLSQNSEENVKEFSDTFWLGVPGCTPATWTKAAAALPPSDYTYLPVFMNKKNYDGYYNGFSNSSIWPLFHYFPTFTEYSDENYNYYQQANAAFADIITKYARPNDVIWIHDYHLLPLAAMVRKVFPEITIGFFLHIPFPSYEILRLMPKKWQEDLLRGMLGADLIGFHTIDYMAHFLKSVKIVLGVNDDMRMLTYENRLIKADVFPISIDFEQFNNAFDNEVVASKRAVLKQNFAGKKLIFSVDRLDYTKGVSNRLRGYEQFLLRHPEYHEKVVFIIVIVPSRDSISRYMERKKVIDEMISNINSKIGNLNWQPVIYQYNSLEFDEMLSLYTACDLALITPLRDGMNLVAKEFVASRKDKQGVLLLSEMAGAAKELFSALTINPNDVSEIAEKIHLGLEMPVDEQMQRMEIMRKRIANYTVQVWAKNFFERLYEIKSRQEAFQMKFIEEHTKRMLIDKYRKSNHRLILLDYDGTLVPYASMPDQARPSLHLTELLGKLAANKNNSVFIVSGRDSATLEKWLGELPINIIAEHGAKMRTKDKNWKTQVMVEHEWKKQVHEIMEMFVNQCEGSFIETKEFAMVWHYRNAHPAQAKLRSMELYTELNEHAYDLGVQVMMGNKIVEVRVIGMDKGSAIKKEVLNDDYDFILAMGDDKTDEDMFKALTTFKNATTIKIGAEASYAQYNLHTPQMAISLLDAISYWPVEQVYG